MVSIRDLQGESSARRGSRSNVEEVRASGNSKDEAKVQYYTESLRANRDPCGKNEIKDSNITNLFAWHSASVSFLCVSKVVEHACKFPGR